MLADAAIFHMSYTRVVLLGVLQLTIILSLAWFGTRQRREDFRFSRVIGLTLFCLSSSLPFAFIGYLLWPWDFQSWTAPVVILLAVFSPVATAYILGIIRKKKMLKK